MTDNVTFAANVVIRHNCDCRNATEPMVGDHEEHVFTINGVQFPWYISEQGPIVLKRGGNYSILVEIPLADTPNVEGVPIKEVGKRAAFV